MKFKTKHYKFLKTQKEFKNENFFFIYAGTIFKNYMKTDQKIKNLDLKRSKIHNALVLKMLNGSIYKNFQFMVSGLLFMLKPHSSSFCVQFSKLLCLENSFKLLILKINNNIFNIPILSFILNFDFKNNALLFFLSFNVYFKKVSSLTYSLISVSM